MNLSGQSGGRASRIVSLQSLPVVGSIVSEDLAHGIELTAVANKPIPEIVTDLVTKVTEQRPVRLVHGGAFPFLVTGQETRWHENVTIKETFTS
jgi:hypothetical protein